MVLYVARIEGRSDGCHLLDVDRGPADLVPVDRDPLVTPDVDHNG